MAGFRQGDVVRVPFPYTNREMTHHRPALVISDGTFGNELWLWVLMITSAENRMWPGDVSIDDLAAAGLPAPSVVRTLKIATIEASHAQALGRIDPSTLLAIREEMRTHLKL